MSGSLIKKQVRAMNNEAEHTHTFAWSRKHTCEVLHIYPLILLYVLVFSVPGSLCSAKFLYSILILRVYVLSFNGRIYNFPKALLKFLTSIVYFDLVASKNRVTQVKSRIWYKHVRGSGLLEINLTCMSINQEDSEWELLENSRYHWALIKGIMKGGFIPLCLCITVYAGIFAVV